MVELHIREMLLYTSPMDECSYYITNDLEGDKVLYLRNNLVLDKASFANGLPTGWYDTYQDALDTMFDYYLQEYKKENPI